MPSIAVRDELEPAAAGRLAGRSWNETRLWCSLDTVTGARGGRRSYCISKSAGSSDISPSAVACFRRKLPMRRLVGSVLAVSDETEQRLIWANCACKAVTERDELGLFQGAGRAGRGDLGGGKIGSKMGGASCVGGTRRRRPRRVGRGAR
jgi:hypothetical protein